MYQLVEGAWNHTAWLSAMLEISHSSEAVPFEPDRWHPYKRMPRRKTRREAMAEMRKKSKTPVSWEEHKAMMLKGKR